MHKGAEPWRASFSPTVISKKVRHEKRTGDRESRIIQSNYEACEMFAGVGGKCCVRPGHVSHIVGYSARAG